MYVLESIIRGSWVAVKGVNHGAVQQLAARAAAATVNDAQWIVFLSAMAKPGAGWLASQHTCRVWGGVRLASVLGVFKSLFRDTAWPYKGAFTEVHLSSFSMDRCYDAATSIVGTTGCCHPQPGIRAMVLLEMCAATVPLAAAAAGQVDFSPRVVV